MEGGDATVPWECHTARKLWSFRLDGTSCGYRASSQLHVLVLVHGHVNAPRLLVSGNSANVSCGSLSPYYASNPFHPALFPLSTPALVVDSKVRRCFTMAMELGVEAAPDGHGFKIVKGVDGNRKVECDRGV